MIMRLDRLLTDMGYGTRSSVKKDIAKGYVTVNSNKVTRPETKIDTEKDIVCWHGESAVYIQYEYFMLNKPGGVVSATEDKRETTVLDLIQEKQRDDLFPVGRLDKDTEGLLLITNNGELAHRLLSPKKHVDKVYYAEVKGKVTEEDRMRFKQGLDIGDEKPTLSADLTILLSSEVSKVEIVLREGRFHQVKRMFRAVGKEVAYLKRLRMGPIVLDASLAPGQYRRLSEKEVEMLCSKGKKR